MIEVEHTVEATEWLAEVQQEAADYIDAHADDPDEDEEEDDDAG
jgi:hypothetical protein